MARVSQLKTKSQSYWEKRFEEQAKKWYAAGDRTEKSLKKLYKETRQEMTKEIQAFYARYGKIQDAPVFETLSDGTKVMTGTSKKLVVTMQEASKPLSQATRLTVLEAQLRNALIQLSRNQNDFMTAELSKIAVGGYYDTVYEIYKGYGIGSTFNLLDPKLISEIIKHPVNGKNFSQRVWANRDKLADTVNQTLRAGLVQGISNNEMAKRISTKMESGYQVAQRLVNTEVTNTYNQASLSGYEASGIVTQYQYLATLDNRTSEVCTALDGEIFDISESAVGLNFPPMHPNCRSTTKAYFDNSEQGLTRIARNLGGNTFTVPANMTAKDFKSIYVDGNITRSQWDERNA